jgi:hypothetical protein
VGQFSNLSFSFNQNFKDGFLLKVVVLLGTIK